MATVFRGRFYFTSSKAGDARFLYATYRGRIIKTISEVCL